MEVLSTTNHKPKLSSPLSTSALPQNKKQPQGTLAFLASMSTKKQQQQQPSERKSSATSLLLPPPDMNDNQAQNSKNQAALIIDPKKDEWRAPEGQDGSGRTKLNATFAGRY
jgi:hypothetical protein